MVIGHLIKFPAGEDIINIVTERDCCYTTLLGAILLFFFFKVYFFSEQAAVLAILVRFYTSKFDVQHAFKKMHVHFDKHWLRLKPLF